MLQTLKKYFGYTQFRPLQQEIISSILEKKDSFVLMPTGGGKSLCYQLPSIMNDGLTVVVSPLISLMKDQVDSLQEMGINSAFINSTLNYQQIDKIKSELVNNKIDLLYVAPERLMMPNFLKFIHTLKINLFAIDEAHCISEWGHDFRPEYRKLTILKEKFPAATIIALTATATPIVQEDIINQLHLKNPETYKASFDRKNLQYRVLPKGDTYHQLCDYLDAHTNDSGIIYCQSRKTVDTVSYNLQQDGYSAKPYHAGMEKKDREINQEMFIKDNVNIIVATIAFGMGIDKPNVRFVVHYDLPKNIEGYYQETGRAGRDGLDSDCILFYSYGDKIKIEYFINDKEDPKERQIAIEKLQEMINYAETNLCRRIKLLKYFGEEYQPEKCNNCDNCLDKKEVYDATIEAQKLLSCVSRVNQRFGVNYVIDVLRGSKSERIIHNYHNQISTYGIGKDISKKQWQLIARELIQLEYLKTELESGQFPVIKLTPKSSDILFKNEKIYLTKFESEKTKIAETIDTDYDKELFERLRTLRKRLADESNVPPYVVFPDTSLKEMSTFFPVTWDSLGQITGVGEQKLKRYGPKFLKIIVGFCQEFDIEPTPISSRRTQSRSTPKKLRSATERKTLEMLVQGMNIKEIANSRELAESTIYQHIEKLILAGENIIIEKFVPLEKQRIIRKVLTEMGTEILYPVKNRLGMGYSYNEIKLVRAKMMIDK